MAAVAVKNHKHGVLNPKAQFQKEITLEQVLKSPMVADPLKLYDCCPFTDGGAAVVLASEEVARKAPPADLGAGLGGGVGLDADRRQARPLARAGHRARGRRRLPAGRPRPPGRRRGRAARLLHDRRDRRHRGSRPLRAGHGRHRRREGLDERSAARCPSIPSGGLKAKGHPIGATGAAQIAEIVTQLRDEAGPRQVDGARRRSHPHARRQHRHRSRLPLRP